MDRVFHVFYKWLFGAFENCAPRPLTNNFTHLLQQTCAKQTCSFKHGRLCMSAFMMSEMLWAFAGRLNTSVRTSVVCFLGSYLENIGHILRLQGQNETNSFQHQHGWSSDRYVCELHLLP